MGVRGWVLGVTLAMGSGASGQQPDANVLAMPPTSVGVALRGLAARSGVVFVGQVQSIVPKDGVVEITFRVQQPVVGVVGGTYVMREWAGRWTGGQQRYRVGQRAMFFLHAPSAAGLSSPVDGMAGVVPLIPMGANTDALLDVRMLAARVARPMGSPLVDAKFGAIALMDAKTVVRNWRVEQQREPMKRSLPAGVLQGPVGASALVEQTDVPRLLQPREQTDVQR
jgi:hypothetical protein